MWLCVKIESERHNYFIENDHGINVCFYDDAEIPKNFGGIFRAAKVFSLSKEHYELPPIPKQIIFLSTEDPAKILSTIQNEFNDDLKTYFSIGSSSIILFDWEKSIFNMLVQKLSLVSFEYEIWGLDTSGKVIPSKTKFECSDTTSGLDYQITEIPDYSGLSLTKRAIIDEFVISFKILLSKAKIFSEVEEDKLDKLIKDVKQKVHHLIFLRNVDENIPDIFSEYSLDDLKTPYINNLLNQQIIDRLIQINSAISYVGSQSISGCLPVLERRSLIRRNSFLGIGTAIKALNNISNFIEIAFAMLPIRMLNKDSSSFKQLPGTNTIANPDTSGWEKFSFEKIWKNEAPDEVFFQIEFL